MQKEFSLRLTVKITAPSDLDAKRMADFYVKELPKIDGCRIHKSSLYNYDNKNVVSQKGN